MQMPEKQEVCRKLLTEKARLTVRTEVHRNLWIKKIHHAIMDAGKSEKDGKRRIFHERTVLF